jgi:hypothetical protein
MDNTTADQSDQLPRLLAEASVTPPSSSNGKPTLQDSGEKAFRDYLDQRGGSLLQRILNQGLSMDENSFPFVLSYLTLSHFRAAAQVPKKINEAIVSAQAAIVKELNALHTQHLTSNRGLSALRLRHLIVIAALAILYFAGGAWFVWRDHCQVQSEIYERVAARTAQALARIQPAELQQHVRDLKALLDLGVHFSLSHDTKNGDVVLTLEGEDGVTLYYPREEQGKYFINIIQ